MGCLCSTDPAEAGSPAGGAEDSKDATDLDLSPPSRKQTFLEVDNVWDLYEFKNQIGVGASSNVALVYHKETNVPYALKIMEKNHMNLFTKELKVLRRLDCPQIVRLHNAYKTPEKQFILLEYCAGNPLIQRIANRLKFSEADASKTFRDMLTSVKYIHDQNLVHRDIKPENFVYMSKEFDAGLKLLDFGIAMDADPEQEYRYRAGTPYYMSPEVIRNTDPRSGELCKKSDMWSLGVCLFIMLNGKAPFKGSTKQALFDNILFQTKIKFSTKNLSKPAKDLVFKLLMRDPKQRITVEEALAHEWIVKGGSNDDANFQSTIDALKLFSAKHSVHRALQKIAKQAMDQNEETYARTIFQRYDKNEDHHISLEEARIALEEKGFFRGEAEQIAKEMIAGADENNDQRISFEEFKSALARHQMTRDQYRIHAIFSALDVNRDGFISKKELQHVLSDAVAEMKDANDEDDDGLNNLMAAFDKADTDQNGRLSFAEFCNILKLPERTKSLGAIDQGVQCDEVLDDNVRYNDLPNARKGQTKGLEMVDAESNVVGVS